MALVQQMNKKLNYLLIGLNAGISMGAGLMYVSTGITHESVFMFISGASFVAIGILLLGKLLIGEIGTLSETKYTNHWDKPNE